MNSKTRCLTPFVGIFNNRRVPFDAINLDTCKVKSEDGLKL